MRTKFFIFLLILTICQTTSLRITINNKLQIDYSNRSACLSSQTNNLKCMLTCQAIKCKSLMLQSNNCTLFYGDSSLVEYLKIGQLKINYIFDRTLVYGERCSVMFDLCSRTLKLSCFYGRCLCKSAYLNFTGLIYSWDFNGDLIDSVKCLSLRNESNATFVQHSPSVKFLYLYGGFLSAPPGIYFSDVFSVCVWVQIKSQRTWARILDFGNGALMDNILVILSYGSTGFPAFGLFNSSQQVSYPVCNQQLIVGEWTHLAFVNDGSKAYIYINGTLNIQQALNDQIRNVTRTRCYIGKSNWPDPIADSYYKNLNIYNKPLNISEIRNDMRLFL